MIRGRHSAVNVNAEDEDDDSDALGELLTLYIYCQYDGELGMNMELTI